MPAEMAERCGRPSPMPRRCSASVIPAERSGGTDTVSKNGIFSAVMLDQDAGIFDRDRRACSLAKDFGRFRRLSEGNKI